MGFIYLFIILILLSTSCNFSKTLEKFSLIIFNVLKDKFKQLASSSPSTLKINMETYIIIRYKSHLSIPAGP